MARKKKIVRKNVTFLQNLHLNFLSIFFQIRLRLADNGPSLIFRDPADAPSTSRTSTTAPNSSNPSSSTSDPTSFEAISQKINSMRLRLADNGPSLVWNGRNVPQASNPGSSNSQR